jgi:hypothetical protein
MGFAFPFFNRGCDDRCKAAACGCGGCGGDGGCGGGCGCGGDDKRIAVITAVRAIAAKGDGCFNNIGNW